MKKMNSAVEMEASTWLNVTLLASVSPNISWILSEMSLFSGFWTRSHLFSVHQLYLSLSLEDEVYDITAI